MTEPNDILVWMQTTVRRDASRTIASIEASDIGERYYVATDTAERTFPRDYPTLQAWWAETWRSMIVSAKTRGCKLILRLEDDIIVNEHILHNVCRWRAHESPLFGVGTLFVPNYWLTRPNLFKVDKPTGTIIRHVIDVEGGQAQLLRTETAHQLLDYVPMARSQKGLDKPFHPPSFDWALTHAAWNKGLKTFVHKDPALVDLHDGSLHSKIDLSQHRTRQPALHAGHYWGDKSFNATWKAP